MVSANPTDELLPLSKEAIDKILTPAVSESIGAILISFDEEKIILCSMNPVYSEVKKINNQLKEKFSVATEIKTISAEEFEKWFDQGDNSKIFSSNNFNNEEESQTTKIETNNQNIENYSLPETKEEIDFEPIKEEELENENESKTMTDVFQKGDNFNPIHNHSGDISGVIYLDCPEDVINENWEHGQSKQAGLDILLNNGDLFHVRPKPGTGVLFNSLTNHCAYPYKSKSDTTRLSASFNAKVI